MNGTVSCMNVSDVVSWKKRLIVMVFNTLSTFCLFILNIKAQTNTYIPDQIPMFFLNVLMSEVGNQMVDPK